MNSDVIKLLNIISLLKREDILKPAKAERIIKKIHAAIRTEDWSEVRNEFLDLENTNSNKAEIFERYRGYCLDILSNCGQGG